MFQDVIGPTTGAKAFRIDSASLTIEIPIKAHGKKAVERIDLKPFLQAHIQSTKPQPGT